MLDLLRQIGEAVLSIAEAFISMVRWIPAYLNVQTSMLNWMGVLPPILFGVALICLTFYIVRSVLGGDNK